MALGDVQCISAGLNPVHLVTEVIETAKGWWQDEASHVMNGLIQLTLNPSAAVRSLLVSLCQTRQNPTFLLQWRLKQDIFSYSFLAQAVWRGRLFVVFNLSRSGPNRSLGFCRYSNCSALLLGGCAFSLVELLEGILGLRDRAGGSLAVNITRTIWCHGGHLGLGIVR